MIEHLSPIYEWSLGGLQLGRTKEFILYGLPESWQYFKIRLFRRHITRTLMNPVRVVSIHVVGNVGSGCADAVVGFEGNQLVTHNAPQALA